MERLTSYLKQSSVSHLLLAVTFFVSGLIINLVQCVLYYGVRPFSRYLFRKINYYVAYSLYCQLVFLAEWWSNSDVIIYMDADDFKKYCGKEHGYLIMNHRYEVDWLLGWVFCERLKLLGHYQFSQNVKDFNSLTRVSPPWVIVSPKKDREHFALPSYDMTVVLDVQENSCSLYGANVYVACTRSISARDFLDLLLMAEGTRFTQEKHEISKKFAREKGLPELMHHLTPRTKGFTSSVPYLRGKVGAIYDIQIAFKHTEKEPTVSQMLHGKSVEAHMYVERIPLENVPEEEEACAHWLHQLYQKKDAMTDSFIRKNDFFLESGVRRVAGFRLQRRYYSLINTLAWAFIVLVPILYYLFRLLTSGSTFQITVGVAIIVVFFLLLYLMIGMTKISKASSYGTVPSTPTEEMRLFSSAVKRN